MLCCLLFFDFCSRLLYPCLDKIEDVSTIASPVDVQDDVIRLAGACLLAISISSIGILAQLLSCSLPGSDVGVDKESSDIFLSRTLFCIQGELFVVKSYIMCYHSYSNGDIIDAYKHP